MKQPESTRVKSTKENLNLQFTRKLGTGLLKTYGPVIYAMLPTAFQCPAQYVIQNTQVYRTDPLPYSDDCQMTVFGCCLYTCDSYYFKIQLVFFIGRERYYIYTNISCQVLEINLEFIKTDRVYMLFNNKTRKSDNIRRGSFGVGIRQSVQLLSYVLDVRGSEGSRLDSRQGQKVFLCSEASRTSLGPSQHPIQCESDKLSPAAKRLRVKLTIHLHLVYSLTMSGAVPPLPHIPSWRAQ